MNLKEALDIVYGHDCTNPIHPYSASFIRCTPYEAFEELKPEYKGIVVRMIGHYPTKGEE